MVIIMIHFLQWINGAIWIFSALGFSSNLAMSDIWVFSALATINYEQGRIELPESMFNIEFGGFSTTAHKHLCIIAVLTWQVRKGLPNHQNYNFSGYTVYHWKLHAVVRILMLHGDRVISHWFSFQITESISSSAVQSQCLSPVQ